MQRVGFAGAGRGAGELVDGEGVSGARGALLHPHFRCAAVPVDGAVGEFVHPAHGARDVGFVGCREAEGGGSAAEGGVAIKDIAVDGVGARRARPVDGSAAGELAEATVGGGSFVSDRVAEGGFAADDGPFEVDVAVDEVGAGCGRGIDGADAEVVEPGLVVRCRGVVGQGVAPVAFRATLRLPFVVDRADDCVGSF